MAIENLDVLEQFIELPEGKKLSDLLGSEDKHEIKLDGSLKIFKEGDHKTLIENHIKDAETAGKEKLLKKMRDDAGLTYEGVKDPSNFISNLTSAVKTQTLEEAKIEPDKKIQELTKDNGLLVEKIGQRDEKLLGWETKWSTQQSESKKDTLIISSLPKETKIDKSEIVTLTKNQNFDIVYEGDKPVIQLNGETVKNDLLQPVDALEYLKTFTSKYATKVSGGSGDGDNIPIGGGSYDKFVKEMSEAGRNEGGEAFTIELQKRIKDGTVKM